MVYPSFGVCYRGYTWQDDAAYFKSIGLKNIRIQPYQVPYPWAAGDPTQVGSYAYWRACAQYFKQQGFWVTTGVSGAIIGGLSSITKLTQNHQAVVAEAQYLLQNGIFFDNYEVGNEHEGFLTTGIRSLTQSNGIATIQLWQGHNVRTGDSITVYGCTPTGYNGTFTATVVNSTTLTYPVDPATTSPASGLGTFFSLDIPTMNGLIRQCATDIKALPGWTQSGMQVCYACYNASYNGGVSEYTDWVNSGLGDLDVLSIHPYGSFSPRTHAMLDNGFAEVQAVVQAFGNRCYISEFNIDAFASRMNGASPDELAQCVKYVLRNYLQPLGVSKFFWYIYSSKISGNNQFAIQNTDGTINPLWWHFFQNKQMFPGEVYR